MKFFNYTIIILLALASCVEARIKFDITLYKNGVFETRLSDSDKIQYECWIREACEEFGAWVEQDLTLRITFDFECDDTVTRLGSALAHYYRPSGQPFCFRPHCSLSQTTEGACSTIGVVRLNVLRIQSGNYKTEQFIKSIIKHELTHLFGFSRQWLPYYCDSYRMAYYGPFDRFITTKSGGKIMDEGLVSQDDPYYSYVPDSSNHNLSRDEICNSKLYINSPTVEKTFGGPQLMAYEETKGDVKPDASHLYGDKDCPALMEASVEAYGTGKWNELEGAIMTDLGWKVNREAIHHCYHTFYTNPEDRELAELPLTIGRGNLSTKFRPVYPEYGMEYLGALTPGASLELEIFYQGQAILKLDRNSTTENVQRASIGSSGVSGKQWELSAWFEPIKENEKSYLIRYDLKEI